MMKIEKDLQNKDLSAFKTTQAKELAKKILQYRNFKTKFALENINYTPYTYLTATQIFNKSLVYLSTGKKSKGLPLEICHYLDKLKGYTTPLTPTATQKRLKFAPRKKQQSQHVKQIQPQQLTSRFLYIIKANGEYHVHEKEHDHDLFIKALKWMDVEFQTFKAIIEE